MSAAMKERLLAWFREQEPGEWHWIGDAEEQLGTKQWGGWPVLLRDLEREGKLESRNETEVQRPERGGRPRRLYRLRETP